MATIKNTYMNENIKEYYKILGVNENATDEDIKTAYRVLCFKLHPDRSNEPDANERMVELNNAYKEALKGLNKVKRVVESYLKKKLKVHLNISMLKQSIKEYYREKGINPNDSLIKNHLRELIRYFLEEADDFTLNNEIHFCIYHLLKNEEKFTLDELKDSLENFYLQKEIKHSNHWKNEHLNALKIKQSLANSIHESIRNMMLEQMLSDTKKFIKSKYLGGDETKVAEVFSKPSSETMWEIFVKEYHPIKKRKFNITQILQESNKEILSKYFDNNENKLNLIFSQPAPIEVSKIFASIHEPVFEKKRKAKKEDFIITIDTDPAVEVKEKTYFIQIVKNNCLNYMKNFGKMPEQKDTSFTLEDKYIRKIDSPSLDNILENFSRHHPLLLGGNKKLRRAYNDTTLEILIRYSLITERLPSAEDQFLKHLSPITAPGRQPDDILSHTIKRWLLLSETL